MKKLIILTLIATLTLTSGCASYLTYQHNKGEVRRARGGEDVTMGQVVADRPISTVAALAADVLTAGVAWSQLDRNGSSSDSSRSANNNASGENTVSVNGDGNTVTVEGSGGNSSQVTQPVTPAAE